MANYIINRKEDSKGYNEVHTTICNHLPDYINRVDIGWHSTAIDAVNYAKTIGWKSADGCYFCSEEAHHG